MKDIYEDYLSHKGVKGMKWGIRNKKDKDFKQTAEYKAGMKAGQRSEKRKRRVKKLIKTAAVIAVTAAVAGNTMNNLNRFNDMYFR